MTEPTDQRRDPMSMLTEASALIAEAVTRLTFDAPEPQPAPTDSPGRVLLDAVDRPRRDRPSPEDLRDGMVRAANVIMDLATAWQDACTTVHDRVADQVARHLEDQTPSQSSMLEPLYTEQAAEPDVIQRLTQLFGRHRAGMLDDLAHQPPNNPHVPYSAPGLLRVAESVPGGYPPGIAEVLDRPWLARTGLLLAARLREYRAGKATPGPWAYYSEDLHVGLAADYEAYDADPDTTPWPGGYGPDGDERSGRLFHGDVASPADALHIAAEADPRHSAAAAELWRVVADRHCPTYTHDGARCRACRAAAFPCPVTSAAVYEARAYLKATKS